MAPAELAEGIVSLARNSRVDQGHPTANLRGSCIRPVVDSPLRGLQRRRKSREGGDGG